MDSRLDDRSTRAARPSRHARRSTTLRRAAALVVCLAAGLPVTGSLAEPAGGPPPDLTIALESRSREPGSPRALSSERDSTPRLGAAGTVRTDTLWSQALGTRKQLVVWLPPSYGRDPGRRYPVAYYLHGAWGSEWDWVRAGKIDQVLDSLVAGGMPEMIVVMPDGDDSFYTTWNALATYADCAKNPPKREPVETYCVPWPHYDDYIARDLVAHVDSSYRTMADAKHRAIAGLSMGGYGAIALALGYPDVFSAAASHSGVVAPTYVGPYPYEGTARFAANVEEFRAAYPPALAGLFALPFGRDTAAWNARDPAHMAARLVERDAAAVPALMLDCGTEDGLIDQNRALHAALDRLGIQHAYAEWPGAHTWSYWHQHVGESLRWIAARIAR